MELEIIYLIHNQLGEVIDMSRRIGMKYQKATVNKEAASVLLKNIVDSYLDEEIDQRKFKKVAYETVMEYKHLFFYEDGEVALTTKRAIGSVRAKLLNVMLKDKNIRFEV